MATKPISVRVPMADYLTFLNESAEMKITMTDWALMKFYNQCPKTLKLKSEIEDVPVEAEVNE